MLMRGFSEVAFLRRGLAELGILMRSLLGPRNPRACSGGGWRRHHAVAVGGRQPYEKARRARHLGTVTRVFPEVGTIMRVLSVLGNLTRASSEVVFLMRGLAKLGILMRGLAELGTSCVAPRSSRGSDLQS